MKKLIGIIFMTLSLFAQAHESLNVVVSMPVGSANDVLARQWVKKYDETFGTSSNVVNKPGAEGKIGIKHFLSLKATDQTIPVLWPAMGHVIVYNESDKQDIIPVVEVARSPWILIAKKDFPANNFKEYLEYVKANPGKVNQGLQTRGWVGMLHRVNANTKTETNIVYYSNRPEVDVASGVLDSAWCLTANIIGTGIESRVKILATSGNIPFDGYPNVTLGTDSNIGTWYVHQGFYTNPSVSKDAQENLYRRFAFIRGLPWAKEMAAKNSVQVPLHGNSKEFGNYVFSTGARLEKAEKEAEAKVNKK